MGHHRVQPLPNLGPFTLSEDRERRCVAGKIHLASRPAMHSRPATYSTDGIDVLRPGRFRRARDIRHAGARLMGLARVQSFSISVDGFGTGVGLSREHPFGHAGERLHEWMFATRWWHEMMGESGGSRGIDDALVRLHDPGVGAEIMGAGKFGYPGWHDDNDWKGWWGPTPPFHTPVFVLTSHVRPSLVMEGGTTFHFIDASPADALEMAREAASGHDVRIGGGPTTIREFVSAGLVDHLHVVVVPIVLGRGVRVWDGLEGVEQRYDVESVSTSSGVTHLTFTRRR